MANVEYIEEKEPVESKKELGSQVEKIWSKQPFAYLIDEKAYFLGNGICEECDETVKKKVCDFIRECQILNLSKNDVRRFEITKRESYNAVELYEDIWDCARKREKEQKNEQWKDDLWKLINNLSKENIGSLNNQIYDWCAISSIKDRLFVKFE